MELATCSDQCLGNATKWTVNRELVHGGAQRQVVSAVTPHIGLQITQPQRGVHVFGVQSHKKYAVCHSLIMGSWAEQARKTTFSGMGTL